MRYPISLCMIVKNEEINLARCLESVKPIVNEIIIVDTGSTDRTKEIAGSYHAQIFDCEWEDDFSRPRNFAAQQASNPWILVLDADEWISYIDHTILGDFLIKESCRGTVKIRNQYMLDGQKQEAVGVVARIYPRKQFQYIGRVHEQVESREESANLILKNSGITVMHDGYVDEVRMNREKFQRNLELLKKEIQAQGETFYLLYQVGKTYFVHKDFALAKQYFERALSKSTGNARLLHSLVIDYGYTLKQLNLVEEAISMLENTVRMFENSSEIWFLLAGLYTQRGKNDDIEKVIQSYNHCLSIGETDRYDSVLGTGSFLAAHNLALLLKLLGDDQLADEFFDHSRRMREMLEVSNN